MTRAQLGDPAHPLVRQLKATYVWASTPSARQQREKERAKDRRAREVLEMETMAEQQRAEYEQELLVQKERLREAALNDDKSAFDAEWGRARGHLEMRPIRIINGKIVSDAVALTTPIILQQIMVAEVASMVTRVSMGSGQEFGAVRKRGRKPGGIA